ncbi:Aste57867_21594 [Aphanomyces stellatus]|uniref:Aste57867_21594 protein n=1 Tax=Aphanomyces stellatus TaxID=120398 RepID=A0A485LJ72_9STRA|nr:hypothetical protein As57867_021525 [Aphanomyces stellatus]VFT98264.1 Aste57867_21594 [Aphanomyces stellatus]
MTDALELELKPMAQWVPDVKRRVCAVCERRFSTFVRKHHCRACGEVICSQCSSHRRVRDLTKSSLSVHTVRLCSDCISPVLVDTYPLSTDSAPVKSSMSLINSYSSDVDDVRGAALRSYMILDTPPEHEYDAICRAAAKTFDCTVAAIGFMDGARQWYKASLGIQPTQVPRDVALCSQLLERPFHTPLVVLDTRTDRRFQHNPLVTGAAKVRFYAAVPIVNHEGYVLGSIMVLDCKPRESVETRLTDMLLHLAKIVMDMLEEHKARELTRLTMIEEASNEYSEYDNLVSSCSRGSTPPPPLVYSRGSSGGATVRQSAEEDNEPALATPPESYTIRSSHARKLDGDAIDAKLTHLRASEGGVSGSNANSASEAACLDLLCRVTDTQQMLAQQQTVIFERLSLHATRMDNLEAAVRNLEAAFTDLAARLPRTSLTSNSDSVGSEFITI